MKKLLFLLYFLFSISTYSLFAQSTEKIAYKHPGIDSLEVFFDSNFTQDSVAIKIEEKVVHTGILDTYIEILPDGTEEESNDVFRIKRTEKEYIMNIFLFEDRNGPLRTVLENGLPTDYVLPEIIKIIIQPEIKYIIVYRENKGIRYDVIMSSPSY